MNSSLVKFTVFVSFIFSLLFVQTANAAVKVELIKPEKFLDSDISDRSRKKDHEQLQKELEALFVDLSSGYVSENQTLSIKVTNIDLLGYVNYTSSEPVRIVRSNDIYKLKFEYQLLDSNQQSVKSGETVIKDFWVERRARIPSVKYSSLYYLKNDIRDWFKNTLGKTEAETE
ncbi:MAG: DUF3016 domain-containing protein [Gammaproteobacteria bacterium]|nr:DUF3016 domain-containing protein [Gammaproteobacteria bacterium]MDH5629506.1 DUF3016 domain-containing protein [Gammaproteobacteria bacterium]